MTIKRLSHKQLKERGELLNGFFLRGNCYTYENAVHHISSLKEGSVEAGVVTEEVNQIIRDIKKQYPDAKYCEDTKLYYSAGMYGNTGQLHKMQIVNANWEKVGEPFYTYF